MSIYAHSATQATSPAPRTSSAKQRASFARDAALDAFGPKAIHDLDEPGFGDRRPDQGPRPLGNIAATLTRRSGKESVRHWMAQAAQAGGGDERRAALEIAGEIAKIGVRLRSIQGAQNG